MTQEMTQPNAKDSEKYILSVLLNPDNNIDDLMFRIKPDYFYSNIHKGIFTLIDKLYSQNVAIDYRTVEQARKEYKFDDIIGAQTLLDLSGGFGSLQNADYHLEILKEKHNLRRLLHLASYIQDNIEIGADGLIDSVMDVVEKISGIDEITVLTAKEVFTMAVENIKKAKDNGGSGIPTGIFEFDSIFLGFLPGSLNYLAARPSMGKSTFARNIAFYNAAKNRPVAFFTLEDTATALGIRQLSSMSKVDLNKLNRGTINDNEYHSVCIQADETFSLYLDESPAISLNALKIKARALKRKFNIQLFVVDYIGLMEYDHRAETRNIEVSKISAGLKAIAKELDTAFLVLSQLSRNSGQNEFAVPTLSRLRDSGSL